MVKPKPKSVLSLDIGSKRIGLAGCDPLGITVKVLPAIIRSNFKQELILFKSFCKERNIKGLVIGLALDDKGNPTEQSKKCKKYGQRIAKALELPIAWVNEHSSTWAAGQIYNLREDRSGKLDSAAALLLLTQWLEEGPELKPVGMASN